MQSVLAPSPELGPLPEDDDEDNDEDNNEDNDEDNDEEDDDDEDSDEEDDEQVQGGAMHQCTQTEVSTVRRLVRIYTAENFEKIDFLCTFS